MPLTALELSHDAAGLIITLSFRRSAPRPQWLSIPPILRKGRGRVRPTDHVSERKVLMQTHQPPIGPMHDAVC